MYIMNDYEFILHELSYNRVFGSGHASATSLLASYRI